MPDWADLEKALHSRVTGARLAHVYRVVETARTLAAHHGADLEKAAVAALMHDYAKQLPVSELLAMGRSRSLLIDPAEEPNPSLLHGPVAAALLVEEGLVTDPDILAAVRWHTTGRAGMSVLERVIWLADCIEPGRSFPGIDEVRALAAADLNGAMLQGLDMSIRHVLDRRWMLHMSTVHAYNWMLGIIQGR